MPTRYVRRAALVMTGFAIGLVIVGVTLFVYFRIVADSRLAERVIEGVDLAPELMRVEEVEGDSLARVVVREVELRDRAGAVVVAAPLVRAVVDLESLRGDGPIELREVLLSEPSVNYVQFADGSSNLERIVQVTAGGEPLEVEGERAGRGVVVRDLRVADGTVRWTSPYEPGEAVLPGGEPAPVRLARVGGTTMRVRSVRDLDLWISSARFGGTEGWRVEVAAASAQLTDPELRVTAMAGVFEEAPSDGIRFALNTLSTERSTIRGTGLVRLSGDAPEFDVQLRADPVALADLRWFVPTLPEQGEISGAFALASRPADRIAVVASDLVVTVMESRITGRLSALVGGDAPASFWDTRLELDPLRLQTVQQLGLVEEMPFEGEVRGTVSSAALEAGEAAALQLDLAATFAPTGGGVETSSVFVRGPVTVGGEVPLRFAGVEVVLQPLHLAALREVAPPEQRDRLRGVLRGTATLTGTPADLRVEGGDLAYEVGGAPQTRLTGITLTLRTEPELTFSLDARAEPLALGTLAELFPSFPFRTARFSGPIRLEGTADRIRIDTELSGAAGLIAVQGTVSPGDPLRFDLSGRVGAFNAQVVLDRPAPIQGPVTGTFAAAGSTQDFRFDVDLLQQNTDPTLAGGRFALEGRFRQPPGGEAQVEVAGDIANFNLGALIGRPSLLPSRVSGSVRVGGGGREPYRFDLDLRGAGAALDVQGFYAAGAIPSYQVTGEVAGLNLRQLPGGESLPQTSLNATLDIRGQGTTLETLAGDYRIDATRSTLNGRAIEALRADLSVRDGVAQVDTLVAALAGTRLFASGSWGLTRPVGTPLQFRLTSSNLAQLAPFLPRVDGVAPQVDGSVELEGTVAGSVRVPVVDVAFRGQNLRYESWRARRLNFDLAATLGRSVEAISGELALTGQDLQLGGRGSLESLELGLEGGGDRLAVRLAAERGQGAGIALTGTMELQGSTPRGVLLDSLAVRAGETAWRLAQPAQVRWGGVEGVRVANLLLQRDGGEGSVSIDGAVPPTGASDLRIDINNLNLDLATELLPNAPELSGELTLNAVLTGPVGDPELSMRGRIEGFQFQGVGADSLAIQGRYDERRFALDASVWSDSTTVAVANAIVPMLLAFENSVPSFELLRNEPLTARIVADSLPLALLTAGVPLVRDAAGVVSTTVEASGTIDRPELDGTGRIIGGAATFEQLGVRYDQINGRFTFDGEVVRVDSLSIRSDGTATASGTIRLVDLERPELYLTATMDNFQAIQNDEVADLTLSGSVALSGRMPQPVLTGNVTLEQGTIYVPDYSQQLPLEITDVDVGQIGADTVSALAVGPGFVENVQISDLSVTVEEGVWLEARDARVEIRGELVVFRSGMQPRMYGNLEAVRGTYALTIGPIVREFDVVSGSVRFFGTADLNPELDITAEHEVRTVARGGAGSLLSILVRVTGTAEYPRITLTSDTRPPLPESELLNYLVFGQPSFRLTQQQGFAQQLLVQELVGGLLVQQLGNLGLPCQYLRLRGRPTELTIGSPLAGFGSTSLECGVQVLPDIFLTLETGVSAAVNPSSNPLAALLGVSLDWQVNDFLAARIAREPVRSGFAGVLFQNTDVPYQWSADVNGTWEFGFPTVAPPMEPEVAEPTLPGRTAPPLPAPAPTPPPAPRQEDPPAGTAAAGKPR